MDLKDFESLISKLKNVEKEDPEIYEWILKEIERQENTIELIPSENVVSEAIMEAQGSVLTNKYSEGYPGKRYYGGNQFVDKIESLAIERAKKLFGAEHVNVQPHSGSSANLAVFLTALNPGDKVLSINLDQGGHLTHGHPLNFSGKLYDFVQYELYRETHLINYEKIREIALKEKPKMILTGYSAYPREVDFKKFKKIADEVGAILFADIAHIAGLVAVGLHQNPVPFCDFVTTTTHKTLRGPRGAIIMCKEKWAKAINRTVFPGIQGGPLEHVISAKAICFKQALEPEFKKYQEKVLENNKAMAKGLLEEGIDLISGGTDNHLILIDLRKNNLRGKIVQDILDEVNICVNKNAIPFDDAPPLNPSGIRIGSPVISSRGFSKEDSELVGKLIGRVINNIKENKLDEKIEKEIKTEVEKLTKKYPLYKRE